MRGWSFGLVLGVCGLAASLGLGTGLALAQQVPQGAAWSYDGKNGPLNWGKLDPAYKACSSGKEQSPIDIRGAHLNKGLSPVEFHYLAGSMSLLNTGHTIRVTPPAGSYIVVDGTRYDLVEFHFHHPGEEAVKGKLPDMTLDLVHKSSQGKSLVIAVRLNEGHANAVLAGLWEHLPKTAGETDTMPDSLNPAGLLPNDRGYWTYEARLPCHRVPKVYGGLSSSRKSSCPAISCGVLGRSTR